MNDKMLTFAMMLGLAIPVCAVCYAAKNNPYQWFNRGYYPYYYPHFYRYPRL